ncbi:TVP38/TMEM64 family protein [Desulfatitalea alkaliphila]|uniref:VTT domain-containing protein n=1 Tax=Desulfatitalea alkaliphila TaxID=2929485 RepID=A0AA41R447_9BACT|nr:VTT domain-containing protein [Desulfatitalea alkaliphila]MCJ8499013.1 VTT domain-containing protein [Desulfatitalea alkaliphila]
MHPVVPSKRTIAALMILLAVVATLVWLNAGDLDELWQGIVNDKTHVAFILGLYLVLPLIGFPITVFLLLLGTHFDVATGLFIMSVGMAAHLLMTFLVANSLLRPVLERYLFKAAHRMPQLPESGFVWPSILFMVVPGLSYTMKNYLLSLSGIPFLYYIAIGLPAQALLGIPIVVVGEFLEGRHLWWVLLVLLLIGLGYGLRYWVKKRRHIDPFSKERQKEMNQSDVEAPKEYPDPPGEKKRNAPPGSMGGKV